jgi:hypothetical protein
LLFNKKNGTIRSAIYLDKEIVNTAHRKDYIVNDFIPKIEAFEKKLALIYVSGFYIMLNISQTSLVYSLLLTSLIFFFFFRSFRATLIAIIVIIG